MCSRAENGMHGVEVARKELPDLVLCDVNMEKMDGVCDPVLATQ